MTGYCVSVARAILLAGVFLAAAVPVQSEASEKGFAPLPEPPKVNEARAKLGEFLFFDSRLSGDGHHTCATCHSPTKGWGDDQGLSTGYTGVEYFRNAPTLFNVAYRVYLMWDTRLEGADLPTAVRDMLTEAHTMNADSRLVQERLKQVPVYAEMFAKAYGPGTDPYGGNIYGAVAEYLKTIRTKDAPFDHYLRGETGALTPQQIAGMELFQGKANCIACHNGPTLSDGMFHVLGVPENPAIAKEAERQIAMLRHYATMGVPNYMNLRQDVGRYVVSKDKADIGKFATPSLWDVGQTAPFMHNGVFSTLEAVIDFYDKGVGRHPNKSTLLKPLRLNAEEKGALLEFLKSLSGAPPAIVEPTVPDYELRPLGKN